MTINQQAWEAYKATIEQAREAYEAVLRGE